MKAPFARLLAFSAALAAVLAGCGKKSDMAALNPASVKTFDAAGAHLDSGGDLYLYMRTEQVLEKLPAKMDEWKAALMETAGAVAPPAEIDAWYGVAKKTLLDTGVTQIRAVGLSTFQLEPELSRAKSVIYTGELQDPGLLWRLAGKNAPHTFASLDFLPASTVYAGFSDFDPQTLWAFVQQVMKSLPDPALQKQAALLPAMAEQTLGMPLADLLGSIDSEFGIVITADESATMTVPAGLKPIVMPRAEGALLIRVKDDRIYNLIVDKMEQSGTPITKADTNGVRSATPQMPDMGLPLKPTVARFGNYLALSTTDTLVQQLARKGAAPPALMKDTAQFQRFARLEKMEGNSFAYLSERGSDIIRKVQLEAMTADPSFPAPLKPNIEKLYGFMTQKFVFSIGRIEKDGWSAVSYSPHGGEQIVTAAVVLPAAILASLTLPAMSGAQHQAEAARSLNELRMIQLAMKQYETDNNVEAGTAIAPADLAAYLDKDSPLGKRAQAEPFVDSLGNPYPPFITGQPPHVPAATAAKFSRQTAKGYWGGFAPGN